MNYTEKDIQNIWHPFTQHQTEEPNICITHAEGIHLIDDQGNRYIDGISSWWTNLFGHCHPYIVQKLKNQLDNLEHVLFAGFTHPPAVELSEKLLHILPKNQKKVFFSDNGSTAVEVALKMAIQFWNNMGQPKIKIIAFKDAYHGDTFGAMSVGARGVFNRPFESLFFEVEFLEIPNEDNAKQIVSQFQNLIENDNTLAAFIFEPLLLGSGGMKMYSPEHLDTMIEIAQKHQVLCIADEVMTGFGRTGKRFAIEYLKNKPDIMCLSKGITGGFLPLGVTSCKQEIFDAFLSTDKLKTFFHGHSYTANPLACTAASAAMDVLQAEWDKVQQLADWQSAHAEMLRKHPKLEKVRTLGTILAFELRTSEKAGYFNDVKTIFYKEILKRGVLLRPLGNTIYVMPPYIISEEELQEIYTSIFQIVETIL